VHNNSPNSRYRNPKKPDPDEDQYLVFKAVHFHNYFLLRNFFDTLREEKIQFKYKLEGFYRI
jgi:hypothetical protein